MYAVGQFVNGQLADRFGSRLIASLGVLGSVSMNIAVFLVILLMSPETTNPRTILLLVVVFWGALLVCLIWKAGPRTRTVD